MFRVKQSPAPFLGGHWSQVCKAPKLNWNRAVCKLKGIPMLVQAGALLGITQRQDLRRACTLVYDLECSIKWQFEHKTSRFVKQLLFLSLSL